jgi:hypothetical protein
VIARSQNRIVGAVLASLPFFLILPALLNAGWGFWASMGVASGSAAIAYLAMTYCLSRMGIGGLSEVSPKFTPVHAHPCKRPAAYVGLPVAGLGCGTTTKKLITADGLRPAVPFSPRFPGLDGCQDAVVMVVKVGECRIDLGRPQVRMLP